jgi:predicted O-methyltransferase YrrM
MGKNAEGQFGIEQLMDMTSAYWLSRTILTAQELGVFAALDKGEATAVELAARLKCSQRGTELLANALVGLGLLEKHGEHLRNGPFARARLSPGKGDYLGGYLDHHANLWARWGELSECVRSGSGSDGAEQARDVRAYIMGMHTTSQHWAGKVFAGMDLTGVRRVIDVGGGSGDYAYAALRQAPDAEAVIFDLPDVVQIARECAELAGVSDRVTTVAGDYHEDELGEGFDLAIVSNILHSMAPDGCVRLLEKVCRCLAPGGRCVVHDFVLNDDATAPMWAALFSLNMLTAGNPGRSYTHLEIRDFLLAAGFTDTKHVDLEGDTGVLIGHRPN